MPFVLPHYFLGRLATQHFRDFLHPLPGVFTRSRRNQRETKADKDGAAALGADLLKPEDRSIE